MARGFRKRVKIAPGVHLNLSKSGMGVSVGAKGASVSFGKKGTYLNTSIPGTGLYSRTKISGGSSKTKQTAKNSRNTQSSGIPMEVTFRILDDGEIHMYYQSGEEIIDPEMIKTIKKSQSYKDLLPQLKQLQAAKGEALKAESAKATAGFTELYKQSPVVESRSAIESRTKKQLERLQPEKYVRREWNIPCPTEAEVRRLLESNAEKMFPGMFKKKQRKTYVESNLSNAVQETKNSWQEQRQRFEDQETNLELEHNAQYEKEYEAKKAALKQTLSENEDTTLNRIENWLCELDLPLEMDAAIEIDRGILYIDLDLPEVEDIPTEYVQILKSGKPSTKNKTQKQIKEEYVQCVFGLAEFLATSLFNICCSLDHIIISGYTQRRDKNGDINDNYIYSVIFTREDIEGLKISDPIEVFSRFKNRMKLSSANTFSVIKPFTEEEALSMLTTE